MSFTGVSRTETARAKKQRMTKEERAWWIEQITKLKIEFSTKFGRKL